MDALPLFHFDPPAIVAKVEVPKTKKVAATGYHVHRCANGHEWSHADSAKGNAAEHTCPVCGKMDWIPRQLNTRIVQESAIPYASPACPNGQCPTPRRSR